MATKIYIFRDLLNIIARYTMDYPNLETGGTFYGNYLSDGSVIIHHVTGCGFKAVHQTGKFYPDCDYYGQLTPYVSEYSLENIGDWHSHHQLNLHTPSSGDINALSSGIESLIERANGGIVSYEMAIATIEDNKPSLRFFSFDSQSRYFEPDVIVLESSSPISRAIEMNLPMSLKQVPRSLEISELENFKIPNPIEDTWLKTTEGKDYFKSFLNSLKNTDSKVTLDEGVVNVHISNPHKVKISFPADFPSSNPNIYLKNRKSSKRKLNSLKPALRLPKLKF